MRSLQEAKSGAELEGTESTLKYRKTARNAIRAVVIVLALSARSLGVSELITVHRQKEVQNVSGVPTATQTCLPFSSTEDRQCMMTEKAIIVTTGELTHAGEFEFCVVVPKNAPFRIEQIRTNTLKMWSTDGTFPVRYKMIRRERLVDGKCPERF